jgi:hypothetical protein
MLMITNLKCCIEGGALKIMLSGRKRWKSGLQVSPTNVHLDLV